METCFLIYAATFFWILQETKESPAGLKTVNTAAQNLSCPVKPGAFDADEY